MVILTWSLILGEEDLGPPFLLPREVEQNAGGVAKKNVGIKRSSFYNVLSGLRLNCPGIKDLPGLYCFRLSSHM